MNREKVIAISVMNGVITLIAPCGEIRLYRQRGIQTLKEMEIREEIRSGRLNPRWTELRELPTNYSISFEDPEIMGRAIATYPLVLASRRKLRNQQRL